MENISLIIWQRSIIDSQYYVLYPLKFVLLLLLLYSSYFQHNVMVIVKSP